MRWIDAIRQSIDIANEGAMLQRTNTTGSARAPSISELNRPASLTRQAGSPHESLTAPSIDGDNDTFREDEDSPPHADDFHLMAQNAKTQVEASQQLLESIDLSSAARQQDVKDALRRSLASLETILDDYIDVVDQREGYFQRRYEKEVEAKRQWEESMKEVAAQHAALELELQRVARDNTRRKRALQEVRANFGAISPALSPQTSIRPGEGPHAYQQQGQGQGQEMHTLPEDGSEPLPSPLRLSSVALNQTRSRGATTGSLSPTRIRTRAGTVVQPRGPAELEQIVQEALKHDDGAETEDSDDDDEFFEAIEAGELPIDEDAGEPVTAIDHAETTAPHAPKRTAPAAEFVKKFDPAPYSGYEHPRTTLPITSDNRPSVSLWAILKGSIGKDLTKISFPVYFNEPTSMLQRMAEDMEFSECRASVRLSTRVVHCAETDLSSSRP